MTIELTEIECRCTSLPTGWPKCGQVTTSGWSPGCDGRALDEAITRLGFACRDDFVVWVVSFGGTRKQSPSEPLPPSHGADWLPGAAPPGECLPDRGVILVDPLLGPVAWGRTSAATTGQPDAERPTGQLEALGPVHRMATEPES